MIASVAKTVFTFFFTVIVSSATSYQPKTRLLVTFLTYSYTQMPFFKVRNPKTVLQTRFISIILFTIIKVSEKVECFAF